MAKLSVDCPFVVKTAGMIIFILQEKKYCMVNSLRLYTVYNKNIKTSDAKASKSI